MNAAKKTIFLLWLLVVASLGNVSAFTPDAAQSRTWEKSFTDAESRQVDASQSAGRHQANVNRAYELASDSLVAAKGTGQLDDAISAATPVGRPGHHATFPNPSAPKPRNVPGTVSGRDFSGHAFDRMQERGFTPSVVENAIQHGTRTPGATPGTFQYFDSANKFNVITDARSGRVITVF